MNHKLLKLLFGVVSILFGVVAANAQSCSTVFAGTTFQPKSGITDTNYDLDRVKFEDPSSESLTTGASFVSTSGGMTQGKYTITADGMQIGASATGENGLFFRYTLTDLITTAGQNVYKIDITFEVAAMGSCTRECHRGINFKQMWTDNGSTKNQYKEYQKGTHTWSQTFTAKDSKAVIAFSEDHSNNGLKMVIKSIKVTGCVDQKIVSENGNKVCAGEPNVLIAKGLSALTYKWEKSTDAKATWETLSGTESTITVEVNGETYFRVTAGGTTLTTDKITSVVCCSVAGRREAQLTVNFTSSSLNKTNRVDFSSLDDTQSKQITSTYTYQPSGNLKEDGYMITHEAANGGWDGWKESGIIDHTHVQEGRALTNNDGILIVNCGKDEKQMFQYTISSGNLCQNTIYDFSAFIANIDSNTNPDHEPVNAGFQVFGMPGNKLLVNAETGDLPYTGEWVEKAESFNSGNYKTFKLIIKNNHISESTKTGEVIGNDIAVDDIEFSTCTPDVKIYTDDKYKSKDTIVCDDGKTVHLKLEAHAVYDLSTFFKTPYYLFQTSTDKITWRNVKTDASTDTYIEIDVPKDEIYETGLWYRVWVGGDKDAVEQSASSGAPGEGCGKLTAASEPILVQYQCKCSPTDKPTVTDYSECSKAGTKPIKDLVTSTYDKLRIYDVETGGTDLGSDATFDTQTVGKKTYYVTNQKNTDPVTHIEYCESERTPINIDVKGAAVVAPDDINVCFNDGTPDAALTFTTDNTDFEYTWKGVEDPTIDATGATYTLARKEAKGSITVTATDKTGAVCPGTATVKYNVKEDYKFELTAPTTVCISNPAAEIVAKFTAGTGDYKWYKAGSEVATGTIDQVTKAANYSDAAVSSSKSTVTYKLEIKNDLCSASKEISVEVADKVDIPLVAKSPVVDNNICLGTTFDIVATYTLGATESLKWSANDTEITGVTGIDLTNQSPTEKTTYKVTLQGGTCEGDGSLTITVDQPAAPNISIDKTLICYGTSINITDSDPSAAKEYKWYRKEGSSGTYVQIPALATKDLLDFVPEASSTYKKVSINGACSTESNEVSVEVQPAIQFTLDPLDKKICAGMEVELKMSGYPSGAELKWTEKGSSTVLSDKETCKVTPDKTTEYTATVTKVCEASKDLKISVLSDMNPKISDDVTICEGSSTTLTVSGDGMTSVTWSPAAGLSSTTTATVTASPAETTAYTATLSNGVCEDYAQVVVTVSPTPRVASVVEIAGASCAERGVKVTGKSGMPPYQYSTDGKTFTSEDVLKGLPSGYTKIYITDQAKCKSDTTISLAPYEIIPDKFFTPNNDGNNELWQVENLNCYEGYIVEIYDRYGRRLYVYKKGSFSGGTVTADFPGWDGTYNGHQMPSTDYWYLITVEEIRKQFNGHFTLKR